jgi:hypothetical protein
MGGVDALCFALVTVAGLACCFLALPFDIHVAVTAFFAMYAGAHRALREDAWSAMTAAEACLFPFHLVLAACGLFMVVSVLRAEGVDEIVNAYVYCLGMWCTFSLLRFLAATALPVREKPFKVVLPALPLLPRQVHLVASDVLLLCVTAGLGLVHLRSGEWCSASLLGVSFASEGIAKLSPSSFRSGAAILVAGFLCQAWVVAYGSIGGGLAGGVGGGGGEGALDVEPVGFNLTHIAVRGIRQSDLE